MPTGLYQAGPRNLYFRPSALVGWVLNAIFQAAVMFVMVMYATQAVYADCASGTTFNALGGGVPSSALNTCGLPVRLAPLGWLIVLAHGTCLPQRVLATKCCLPESHGLRSFCCGIGKADNLLPHTYDLDHSNDDSAVAQVGSILFSVVVVTVHLEVASVLDHWTPLHHLSIWFSVCASSPLAHFPLLLTCNTSSHPCSCNDGCRKHTPCSACM